MALDNPMCDTMIKCNNKWRIPYLLNLRLDNDIYNEII